jgi:hypothetical protein
MKEDAWTKKQLKEIEQLQRGIIVQQAKIDDQHAKIDETLDTVKKESALVLKKINDLDGPDLDPLVTPELEQMVKVVSARAKTIDRKVSDDPCSTEETSKRKGK